MGKSALLSGEGLAWHDFFSVRVGEDWGGGDWGGAAEPLPLCERERKDVLGNSNKLARSFVGLELRSHCSPYWRGLYSPPVSQSRLRTDCANEFASSFFFLFSFLPHTTREDWRNALTVFKHSEDIIITGKNTVLEKASLKKARSLTLVIRPQEHTMVTHLFIKKKHARGLSTNTWTLFPIKVQTV